MMDMRYEITENELKEIAQLFSNLTKLQKIIFLNQLIAVDAINKAQEVNEKNLKIS